MGKRYIALILEKYLGRHVDKNIFWQTLKNSKVSILVFSLGIALYSVLLVSLFPTVEKVSGLTEYWQSIPEGMKAFFSAQEVSFNTLEGFINIEFVFMWILISSAFVIALATKFISKEVEDGTMELLLSYPVSRRKIIVSRSLVAIIGIFVLVLATILGILITAYSLGIEFHSSRIIGFGLVGFFLVLAVYSYSLIFSCIFNERAKASLAAVGLTLVFYILDVFAKLSDKIKDFHFLSIFKYYNPQSVLNKGDIYWSGIGILLLISIICFTISLIVFERKDIKT